MRRQLDRSTSIVVPAASPLLNSIKAMKRTKAWKRAHRTARGRMKHRPRRCAQNASTKKREVPDFLVKLIGAARAKEFCHDAPFRHRHD